MVEMEYKGGAAESDLPPVPLDEALYEQYTSIMDACFYAMRKALNIRPYEKHSYALETLPKLEENTFLLLNGGEIIGAVTCSANVIENLAINLNYQRQGYGRKLMEFAIGHMQRRGDSPIKLTVAKWNQNAIALYQSLGFEITKESAVEGVNTQDAGGHWRFAFTAAEGLRVR